MSGKLLLMGDINIHMETHSSVDTIKFNEILYSLNLKQHVMDRTHIKGHMLDVVITREDESIVDHLVVIGSGLSDHYPIMFNTPWHKPKAQKKLLQYRMTKDIDIVSLRENIKASELCISTPEDVETIVDMYNKTLVSVMNRHAPLITKEVKMRPNTEWFSDEIRAAIHLKRQAERRWRESKLTVHFDLLVEAQKK